MTDHLRVRVHQWASGLDPADNRVRLAQGVAPGADLVVLPEAFARDFGAAGSDVSAYAEPLDGPFAHEVARVADAASCTVVAGMFETAEDPGRPYNTLVARGGASASYRKIHLYDSFGYRESDRLTGGALDPVVIEVAGWQVGLMTCYDLRFPELARRLVDAGAEVIVVPAAWLPGERKVEHWRTLLAARAIENTCFVVGAGQPEPRYSGHSAVLGPLGDTLAAAAGEEETLEVVLDREELAAARRTNPSLANRRL
ncbi:carbon-nitrogen hydrolase family protein [Nocardioides hwasunensis]|uniref:Carbon-nitrogen hydrolase family protein n=1 Tax=Nocardioides hwasunensis TaxID=397258 RepID=A0ABR8MK80_9ACTN|nr:carbon-nitrogen hydrolase family protein [Nocardioides hwasunensis]MBD3916434.1 carbon-nitrogen hydrolase family protein [Nocardioides hwasunensis]